MKSKLLSREGYYENNCFIDEQEARICPGCKTKLPKRYSYLFIVDYIEKYKTPTEKIITKNKREVKTATGGNKKEALSKLKDIIINEHLTLKE